MGFSFSERWIYGFRKSAERTLSEDELRVLRGLGRRQSRVRFLWGFLCIIVAIGGIASIAVAADGLRWAWILGIGAGVAFFYFLSLANQAETLSLLYRRAARLGVVEVFERTKPPLQVQDAYRRRAYAEEEGALGHAYWLEEERFEKRLGEMALECDSFEVLLEGDVLIKVGGRFMRRVIQASSVRIELGSADPSTAS